MVSTICSNNWYTNTTFKRCRHTDTRRRGTVGTVIRGGTNGDINHGNNTGRPSKYPSDIHRKSPKGLINGYAEYENLCVLYACPRRSLSNYRWGLPFFVQLKRRQRFVYKTIVFNRCPFVCADSRCAFILFFRLSFLVRLRLFFLYIMPCPNPHRISF